jgi:hypothetical protein
LNGGCCYLFCYRPFCGLGSGKITVIIGSAAFVKASASAKASEPSATIEVKASDAGYTG